MRPLLLALLVLAPVAAHALDGRRLHVDAGRLVDERDREVTLRGVNARAAGIFDVTFADGRLPLEDIPRFDAGDARRMRAFGFNLLRLPISWSALEPVERRYDQAYIQRIAAVVEACRRNGILVLLDFHQDAFSKEIGQDGAPRWVLDLLLGPGGYPHLGGPLTDLTARRFAPATLAAFKAFFRNEHGVQDRMAAAARVLARRFAHERAVLGYETLNEPFAAAVLGAVDAEPALLAFHVRMAQAIRAADAHHLIAFEPDTIRNLLNQAPLPAAPFPDAAAVYAPHVYTGVFDLTTFTGDPAVLAPSMERAAMEAARWRAPLLVGEWGIDPTNAHADEWITAELDLQDRLRAHSTFWLWEEISSGHWGLYAGESDQPGGERLDRTAALSRVFARAVPGRVTEHTVDAPAATLRLRYDAVGAGTLELYVPARHYPDGFTVTCDGQPAHVHWRRQTGVATLRCAGAGERLVELAPAQGATVTVSDGFPLLASRDTKSTPSVDVESITTQ
jgi:endoglycosylceramidase